MSTDAEFWHGRWQEGFTPWHEGRVNRCLERHFALLGLAEDALVLAPLCGKAVDMRWLLEQRCRVLGVELSPIAARAFFEDHGLRFEEREEGPFTVLEGERLSILCGDFFDLTAAHLAQVGAVYDRAAVGALDVPERGRYAALLCERLPVGVPQLVITLEYDRQRMEGPPFSVGDADMRRLYDTRYGLRTLESSDVLDDYPRFRERGLDALTEHAFLMLDNGG